VTFGRRSSPPLLLTVLVAALTIGCSGPSATSSPTAGLSASPTATLAPLASAAATVDVTLEPSPTAAPTTAPTHAPTHAPTAKPTTTPTHRPTAAPTQPPASLVVTTATYSCGGTCWGVVTGSHLMPGAAVDIHAGGSSIGTSVVDSDGTWNHNLGLSCGSGWTNVYVVTTTAYGAPITSNVVNSACG
jgi:hypothetical protein